jgi:hypothetical protein
MVQFLIKKNAAQWRGAMRGGDARDNRIIFHGHHGIVIDQLECALFFANDC